MVQKAICILGMHRSGTSCLAGSLQAAGVFLGEVHTNNHHNSKGNREHILINQLQEQVLKNNGGSWYNPPKTVKWSQEHLDKLFSITAYFNNVSVWGFKDPRSLLTVSGLQEIISDIQFVGTFRNPASVVASLQRRNPDMGNKVCWLDLWNIYNKRLLELWSIYEFPVINFDKNDKEYMASLVRLYGKLGLKTSCSDQIGETGMRQARSKEASQDSIQFFDPSLRSGISSNLSHVPANILETYDKLRRIALE